MFYEILAAFTSQGAMYINSTKYLAWGLKHIRRTQFWGLEPKASGFLGALVQTSISRALGIRTPAKRTPNL